VLDGTWKPEIHTTIWARCVVRSQARFDGPLLHSISEPNTIMNPTVWFSFFFAFSFVCCSPVFFSLRREEKGGLASTDVLNLQSSSRMNPPF
jgi:hypothetical protein